MKRTSIVITFLFFQFCAISQMEFAPIGAKWWYKANCFFSPDCGYIIYEAQRDTLLSEVTAVVIERNIYGGEINNGDTLNPIIMYADNNKVFHYDYINQEFYVLYDFNLSAGDTLTIQDGDIYRGYVNPNLEPETALFQVVIDSNVVRSFGGYMLQHLYTSPTELSNYFFNGPIIERIGNRSYMFGEQIQMLPGGYPSYLRCYKDEIYDFNFTINSCDYIESSNLSEYNNDNVMIFPNPTYGFFQIKLNDEIMYNKMYNLVLYDTKGREVYFKNLENIAKNEIEIDIRGLKTGIYYLSIIGVENYIYKIIKMN